MKKYTCFVFLLASFLISCNEDKEIDITVMPEETATGANSFACLIDGWIYVGGRYSDRYWNVNAQESIFFKYNASKNEMRVEVKVKDKDVPYAYIAFTMIHLDDLQNCQFIDAKWLDKLSADNEGKSLGNGTVEVTHFDSSAKIISGRFSGDQIKHGQFDVEYR
jgi:hypothetical protein